MGAHQPVGETSYVGSLSLSVPPSPRPAVDQQPRSFQPVLPSAESTIVPPSLTPPQAPRLNAGEAPVLLFSPVPQAAAPAPPPSPPPAAGADNPLRHLTQALGSPEAAMLGPEGAASPTFEDQPAPPIAADLLLDADEPKTPPHPTAAKRSKESVYAERPPPQKLGQDWDDSQWLAKAFELADTFADIGHAVGVPFGTTAGGGNDVPVPRSPRMVQPAAPCDTQILHAGGSFANLAEEIEKHGFEAIPDWFTPLDRIYEVCDMSYFHVDPEPMAAAPGLAGAPGYSYVVPKSSRPSRPRGRHVGAGGGARPQGEAGEAAQLNSDALLRRYQHRIVHTSLPSASGAAATR